MATLTPLGAIQRTTVPWFISYGRVGGAGDIYSWWWYWPGDSTVDTNLISLNHDDGVIVGSGAVSAPPGRPTPFYFHHPVQNKMYGGCFAGYGSPGWVISFDYTTATVTELFYPPAIEGIYSGARVMTYSDEPNKRIFVGTDSVGSLLAWDPVTEGEPLQDYGVVDDPGTPYSAGRYILSLQVTGSYAYCVVKDPTLYLVVVRLSDGAEAVYWKGLGASGMEVRRGNDGTTIYFKRTISEVVTWWQADGFNTPTSVSEPSYPYGDGSRDGDSIAHTGYDINTDLAYPPGDGTTPVTLRYKKTGDTEWRTINTDVIDMADYGLNGSIGLDIDNNIILFGEEYAPAYKLYTSTGKRELLGAIPMSGYSCYGDVDRGKNFLGGYSLGATLVHDPTADWISYVNPAFITVENPESLINARYARWVDKGSDGNIWWGFDWVRTSNPLEGQISWYDPEMETTGTVDYTTLKLYTMDNVCMNQAKDTIVYSGWQDGVDSYLFVIDVATKDIVEQWTPIAAGPNQGRIVCVGGNNFVGITVGASYKCYSIDVSTGTVNWGPIPKTGTSSFGRYEASGLGPIFAYGYVWFYVGNDLVKMDPNTGAVEVVQALANAGNLFPGGNSIGSLYHMDYTTKLLWKVGELSPGIYSKGSYISLPTDDGDLDTPYTGDNITDVAADDTDMVGQLATSQLAIHQFKKQINGKGGIINVVAQVTIPCSTSNAYLQIYNRQSDPPAWDTIDSDNATGANTDFPLSATVADLTDYKDENNIVACRVYQEMQ